ncbi:ABC transporter permease [Paenibacillus sp. JTLBN-2024]
MNMELIRAEGLKLKRLCRLIPFLQGIILISMTALEWYLYFRQGPRVYAGFAVMYMFISFVFLLGITILASIMAGTEHETKAWKQLLAMPIPKGSIYLAKLLWIFHFAAVHRGDYGRGHVHHLVFIYRANRCRGKS